MPFYPFFSNLTTDRLPEVTWVQKKLFRGISGRKRLPDQACWKRHAWRWVRSSGPRKSENSL